MTQDRFIRRLPELMDDLGRGDDSYVDSVLRQTVAIGQRGRWPLSGLGYQLRSHFVIRAWREASLVLAVVGLIALLALVVGAALYAGGRHPELRPPILSNGWIAYSTMPGNVQVAANDTTTGGDIYLIRMGVAAPIMIASRGGDGRRNVCPAFSPDGRLLAFGTSNGEEDRHLVVLGVADDGSTTDVARMPLAGSGPAPCAMWSGDGTKLAYVDGDALVIRALDGSVRTGGEGDPTIADLDRTFRLRDDGLVSPHGDRVADDEDGGCEVIVTMLDGSDVRHPAPGSCPYSIAAWSPDAAWLVLLSDFGNVQMKVARIDGTERVVLVPFIAINGSRSFPGRGDVSWQPVYR